MHRPYKRLEYREQDGVFCVRIKAQKLQENGLDELSTELARLVDEEDCRKMVLSLGPGEFECLYSVFLAKLVNLQRRLENAGGRMVLAEATPAVQGIFRAAGLERHFTFFADPLHAVQALACLTPTRQASQ
jgi:anti-anti-sigma factor